MNRYLLCAALAGSVIVFSVIFQRPITYNDGLGWDGAQYAQLASQCGRERLHAFEPFTYRVGVPCLAALIPVSPKRGLWAVNLASAVLLVFLIDAWIRRHVSDPTASIVLVAFALHWVAPLRQVWWYPTYIDPAALCAIVGALLLSHRLVPFAVICFAGALIRETMLIVPLALMCAARVRRARSSPSASVPPTTLATATVGLGAGLIGIGLAHVLATPTSDYWVADAAFYWAYTKPLPVYVHGLFVSFGPALALIAVGWAAVKRHLLEWPEQAFLLACVLVLAWIGGSDTERFLMWGSPTVLVLIGKAAEQMDWSRAKGVAMLLAAGQIVSGRWFLAIPPDFVEAPSRAWPILTPWFARSYLQLYSQTPDRVMGAVALLEYLVFSLVLIAALSWTRSRATVHQPAR